MTKNMLVVGQHKATATPVSTTCGTSSSTQLRCTCLQTKQDQPVARWDFISPVKADDAAQFAKKWRATGFAGAFAGDKLHLSLPRVLDLQAAMGTDPATGQFYVLSWYQFAGQRVHVRPGWMHQVTNLQPCLKLAWDFYTKAQMPAYIASWQLIASPIMRHNAEDYMAVGRVLVKAITNNV